MSDLIAAARAVVERWETPAWKDAPATAGYIYALRDAVQAAASPEPVAQVVSTGAMDLPLLQWMSADHSFRVPIGTLLYAHPPAERIALLEAENAKLKRLLADAHVTMNHASIFISTREKMHPTGQELYGKLCADIAAALGEG